MIARTPFKRWAYGAEGRSPDARRVKRGARQSSPPLGAQQATHNFIVFFRDCSILANAFVSHPSATLLKMRHNFFSSRCGIFMSCPHSLVQPTINWKSTCFTTAGTKFMSRCNRAWDASFARSMQPQPQLQTGIHQQSLLANVGIRIRKRVLFFSGQCARARARSA